MDIEHVSAESSRYDEQAETYDALCEDNGEQPNALIEKILAKHNVKTVLDMTCGTGIDINEKMLEIAKGKATEKNFDIKLLLGDRRSSKVGQFDAVISSVSI